MEIKSDIHMKRGKMRYLCFDIECCDGQHICEFGYVLIDENFNVLERDCITINPEHKFKLTGREHESDITLAFPEEIYFNSPTFDYYYDRIRSLLTLKNCQIIGFSLTNDAGFLATAYEIYNKEPIPFTYIDFQKLYQGYVKSKNRVSVESIVKELDITDVQLHKSDDDSWAIVRALQVISKKECLSLPETISMLKKRNNNYQAEKAKEHNLSLLEKVNSGNEKAQREFLKNFIKKKKLAENPKDDVFFGKSVCISYVFQHECFNEFLALIDRIYFYGATYTGKASDCDIFIDYGNDDKKEIRYSSAKQVTADGHPILFMSLEEALTALKLNKADLSKTDYINQNTGCRRKGRSYIDKTNIQTTIGDIMKAKGIKL